MGTCSANLHKSSTDTKVTLKLKPIAKKATFNITDDDVTKLTTTGDGKTVKAKELPIGEKAFVPFTALHLVYYMLKKPTGYSISSRSVILRMLVPTSASPPITATPLSFSSTSTKVSPSRGKKLSEWYVSFF